MTAGTPKGTGRDKGRATARRAPRLPVRCHAAHWREGAGGPAHPRFVSTARSSARQSCWKSPGAPPSGGGGPRSGPPGPPNPPWPPGPPKPGQPWPPSRPGHPDRRAHRAGARDQLVGVDLAVVIVVEALDQVVEALAELGDGHLGVAVLVVALEAADDRLLHDLDPKRPILVEREDAIAVGIELLQLVGAAGVDLRLGDAAVLVGVELLDQPLRAAFHRTAGTTGAAAAEAAGLPARRRRPSPGRRRRPAGRRLWRRSADRPSTDEATESAKLGTATTAVPAQLNSRAATRILVRLGMSCSLLVRFGQEET